MTVGLATRMSTAVNKQLRSIDIYSASGLGRSAFTRIGSNRSHDRYNLPRPHHNIIFASSIQNTDLDDTSSNNSNNIVETHTEQVWTTTSHRGLTYQESANWWECVRCTYHNSQDTNKCQICKQIKGGGRAITRSLTSHQQPHASASNSHDDINIIKKKYMTQHQSEPTRQTRDVETIPLPLSLMLPQVAIIIMSQVRRNKI